jgi:hypothetical protein
MNKLIKDYFERDLTPAEEARLHRLLQTSEASALEFSRRAEKHYAALGLTAAAVLLAKGGAGTLAAPAGGWFAKLLGAVKVLSLKTAMTVAVATAVVGGAAVAAVKLLPKKAQPIQAAATEVATAPAAAPKAELSGDGLAITLELRKARVLGVAIFDAEGRPVRHYSPQRYEAGVQRLLWDGLDDSQQAVPAGRYRVAVDLGTSSMERWLEVR